MFVRHSYPFSLAVNQIILASGVLYIRNGNVSSGTWLSWYTYSYNIPDFYKSYNSLSLLRNALGIREEEFAIPVGGTYTFPATSYGALYIVQEYSARGFGNLVLVNYSSAVVLGNAGGDAGTTAISYSISNGALVLTNNDSKRLAGTIRMIDAEYNVTQ